MELKGKLAVVLGASSGIGAAVTEALVRDGARLAIGARRQDRLEIVAARAAKASPLAPTRDDEVVLVVRTDVTRRDDVRNLVRSAEAHFGASVDILVNSAGVMFLTLMKNIHEDEWEQTVDVNIKGMLNGVGAVLGGMLERGAGHIVTISSDASRRMFPSLAVYCASKQFIDTVSEGMRRELVGTGVKVTVIQPGDVRTDLVLNNTDHEAAQQVGVRAGAVVGEGWGNPWNLLKPEDVADAVIHSLTAPAHVAVNEILVEPRDQS